MKEKIIGILLLLTCFIGACGNEKTKQVEVENCYVVKDLEAEVVSKENTHLEVASEEVKYEEKIYDEMPYEEIYDERLIETDKVEIQNLQKYSSAGIYFEYPEDWICTEQQDEEGKYVSISMLNKEKGTYFSIVQGDVACIHLDYEEEEYEKKITEMYEDVVVLDSSIVVIDGYDAQKLQFTYNENGQAYNGMKYMVRADLIAFEITYLYPLEKNNEYKKQGEMLIESMRFVVAKESIKQTFLEVLMSKQSFEYVANSFVFRYVGCLQELVEEEKMIEIVKYAINDLDGDEVPEIILAKRDYMGFVVLKYREGQVYATDMNYRAMIDLRENGMARATDSAAVYWVKKMYFIKNTLVSDYKLHADCQFEPNYYLNDILVTEEVFEQLESKLYKDVPEVEWYDFEEESIRQHIVNSLLFQEISYEKAQKVQKKQEYLDSLAYLLEVKNDYLEDEQREINEQQYYYECKKELEKIYELCVENHIDEEFERLESEQKRWEEGICERVTKDMEKINLDNVEEQWLYIYYGDMYLRRTLYLINNYYGCNFYN